MHRETRKRRSYWISAQDFDGSASGRHVVVVALEVKYERVRRQQEVVEAREWQRQDGSRWRQVKLATDGGHGKQGGLPQWML